MSKPHTLEKLQQNTERCTAIPLHAALCHVSVNMTRRKKLCYGEHLWL